MSYMTHLLTSSISSLWILAFYNVSGLRNGWFTVFIDVDQVDIFLLDPSKKFLPFFDTLFLYFRVLVKACPVYYIL